MSKFLLWTGKEVLHMEGYELFSLRNQLAYGDFLPICVDLNFSEPEDRYGRITNDSWLHVPLEDFPKEFRVHLLLLGVA